MRDNDNDDDNANTNDSDSDSGGDEISNTNGSDGIVSESEILYSMESFNAVVTPVTITMVVSALAVVFINTEETIAAGEEIYAQIYQVFDVGGDESSDQSVAQKLGLSLVNTLVIVAVICALTFVVVLCYKYRCMKCFYCYMVLVTAALLSYFTSSMVLVAISIYPWMNIDKLSFVFLMYNFAAVGTVSIFLPRGFPRWIPQGYLIAGSVCLAWQLSYFNSWMTWTLLVMLALYDLFAVLTPCGPLKALAELISKDGAPALPGMLYEARLPSGARRRTGSAGPNAAHPPPEEQATETETNNRNSENDTSDTFEYASSHQREQNSTRQQTSLPTPPLSQTTTAKTDPDTNTNTDTDTAVRPKSTEQHSQLSPQLSQPHRQMDIKTHNDGVSASLITDDQQQMQQQQDDEGDDLSNIGKISMSLSQPAPIASIETSSKGKVPIALAKLYKLPFLDTKGVLRPIERDNNSSSTIENNENDSEGSIRRQPNYYSVEEMLEIAWTPQQLKTEVTCLFPPRGGRIAKAKSREQKYDAGIAYIVYDRLGNQQRKFVVTPVGSIMEVRRHEASGDGNGVGNDNDGDDQKEDDDNTIKLGIGDFIFYSVLVSKAAQYSFTAFASCLLVVLWGLAATLVILAIKGKALPALPISVFLGVIVFLWTRTFLQPWVGDLLVQTIYV